MLVKLKIKNLALIDDISLDFKAGLTVVTGETGAGKSILIHSLMTLLGEAVDREIVKSGCKTAIVEGMFKNSRELSDIIDQTLDQINVNEEPEIVLRREISSKGRSRYLINDQVVKRDQFRDVGSYLLDVNSQHSHQQLLDSSKHLLFFDSALPENSLIGEIKDIHRQWLQCTDRYMTLKKQVIQTEQRKQLLEYQIEEIDESDLRPGEKEELIQERERLRYAEEIIKNIQDAISLLETEETGLSDQAGQLHYLVDKAASKDKTLNHLAVQAENLNIAAQDLIQELMLTNESIEISPQRLEEVSERLHQLQGLEARFQNDISGIIQYREEIEQELNQLSSGREELNRYAQSWFHLRDRYFVCDKRLREFRNQVKKEICSRIESGLRNLGMKKAIFDIRFEQWQVETLETPSRVPDRCMETGTDLAEFLFSANPGIPLKSMSKIASGGELSRVMLALKQVLGKRDKVTTMIFDEVDTGIGGDVANAVGSQLLKLAGERQVICVTHLPQIAVCGQYHIVVEKSVEATLTRVTIGVLDQKERKREIARMLSGNTEDNTALQHAEKLLNSERSIV